MRTAGGFEALADSGCCDSAVSGSNAPMRISTRPETRWEFETEFRYTGFLRIMALLTPGMFRRALLKDMTNFKRFAESQNTNA